VDFVVGEVVEEVFPVAEGLYIEERVLLYLEQNRVDNGRNRWDIHIIRTY